MDDSKTTVKLMFPITVGGAVLSQLELKKPKAKHLKDMPAEPKFGDLMRIAAKLADLPPSTVDELEAADAMAVAEAVGNLLAPGQKTGVSA
jgi:hypothetical protein